MLLAVLQKQEKQMVIEGASGVIGAITLFGGIGGTAFVLAATVPMVGIVAGTLTVAAGVHVWLTRSK